MRVLPLTTASWKFRDATRRSPWRAAVVPGCVHRDLLRHALIPDPFWGTNEEKLQWIEERDWEYRAQFTVTGGLLEEEVVELVADGLDTVATVFVNGRKVARTESMFVGHRWDVGRLLKKGRNEILIRFDSALAYIRATRKEHHPREFNDPVGRSTVIRKQQCQFGWDWGPRLVTAGIWSDIRLEAWSGNRLESIRVVQDHRADGSVALLLTPDLARADSSVTLRWQLTLNAACAASGQGPVIDVPHPQLWWPNGHGDQPLYRLEVEVSAGDGTLIGRWSRRIGLRTIVLDRSRDVWGESFRFVVNGRALFAKGANWIPAHSFVAGLTRDDYARDLRAAAQAHMNMIRVWGGGIYESEDFYDLCDELGLLVWQDFMFACTLYPGDEAFLASARDEAKHQVRRLRHRASLALWCGNNEVFGINHQDLLDPAKKHLLEGYEALFHRVLPDVVQAQDTITPYWPSSPWRGDQAVDHTAGEQRGDTHYWDVWHGRHPVKDYEKYHFRFVSEFGMQSFPSPQSMATFCPPDDTNIFGVTMKNHQKNRGGNQVILDYVSRRYRFPNSQESLIYLSQLNQADCMQTGVQHWRRNMPRCMGALYWQLNDCWPVASWSSIEFNGRWRALHHVARRFFAPALVSAHVPGDEFDIIGNYRRSSVREVHLYTTYDAPQPARGIVRWDLYHLDGRRISGGRKPVNLRYGESVKHKTLDLARPLAEHGRDTLYLRIALDLLPANGRGAPACVSEDTVFLTPPRYLALPRARTRTQIEQLSPTQVAITFTSDALQHRFAFDLDGFEHTASDNYFELYADEPRTVHVTLARPAKPAQLKRALIHRSLVDSY